MLLYSVFTAGKEIQMAQICKPSGQVEIECFAEESYNTIIVKQDHIPKICTNKFPRVELHEADRVSFGSIRK